MMEFLNQRKPFPWRKKGLLFDPTGTDYTHASHPCAIHYVDDTFIIAFTRRDQNQRSHIFLSYAEARGDELKLVGSPTLALAYGNKGCFDCDGVISSCFVSHAGNTYLYYVGWQNLPEKLWICDTGRTVLDPQQLSLRREFDGPVLGRDKSNPLFAAATAFQVSEGLWRTWYNSGVRWEKTEFGWKHYYGIHYAEAANGIDWNCRPGMCIPFADKHEYAFGRPTVFRQDNTLLMWFAHRETSEHQTYRIGFASSKDGLDWNRNDELSGMDVSPNGWDSEMICYPNVFSHRDHIFMLYNGNGYGRSGFGYATMELSALE